MKYAALTITLVAGIAQAEAIVCPTQYQGAPLIGAGMYAGQEKAELVGGARKVRGGVNADFGFNRGDVKWVACWYKPATPRWYRVEPTATRCDLKKRAAASGKVTAVVNCK